MYIWVAEDGVQLSIWDILPEGGGEPKAVAEVRGPGWLLEEVFVGVGNEPACEGGGKAKGCGWVEGGGAVG